MTDAILITGCAGFIGFHCARRALRAGRRVIGIDDLNAYYDPALKQARLAQLSGEPGFRFERLDIADRAGLDRLMGESRFAYVLHFAAQAGVRYSLEKPQAYIDSNLVGFANLLEACRRHGCRHLIYASSSSVYGANTHLPFRASECADHPVSLYAATKKANEGMAHSYAHLFGLPTTGLRFFTVYGPWGRPDMAMTLFAHAITSGKPLRLFEDGRLRRDYTYVDDVADAVEKLIELPPSGDADWSGNEPDPSSSTAPWRIVNVGSGRPIEIRQLVALLEQALGAPAIIRTEPMQPGDMPVTYADVLPLEELTGMRPSTPLAEGVAQFAAWYRDYYGRN